jgi:hypothetical protein
MLEVKQTVELSMLKMRRVIMTRCAIGIPMENVLLSRLVPEFLCKHLVMKKRDVCGYHWMVWVLVQIFLRYVILLLCPTTKVFVQASISIITVFGTQTILARIKGCIVLDFLVLLHAMQIKIAIGIHM